MKIKLVGIDPALANIGVAHFIYDVSNGKLSAESLALLETKRGTTKQVRSNSDDLRRAQEGAKFIQGNIQNAAVVFAEIPVGSQSARAMAGYGISIGLMAGIGAHPNSFDGTLIQLMPSEVKLCATGSKHASKQEMIEWATETYPNLPWLTRKVKGKVSFIAKNEHMADACAVIHAGLQTDEFRNLTNALAKISSSQE